jgi:thimet oligopeptidase
MAIRSRRRGPVLCIGAAVLAVIAMMCCGCLQPTPSPPASPTPNISPGLAGPIRTTFSPGEIPRLSAEAEATANASLASIAALPEKDRTVERTLLAFEETMADYYDGTRALSLAGDLSTDPAVAAEGIACREAIGVFESATYTRRDLYDALREVVPRTPEEARLAEVTLERFEKNGLALPDDELAKVRALRNEITALEVRYLANLNNDSTTIECTEAALAGLDGATIAGYTKGPNGTRIVPVKHPAYQAVMTGATSEETRKAMYIAFNNRQATENTRLLEEAIVLRQRLAATLGYDSWADYRLEGRMASNTSTVMAFLSALQAPLLAKNRAEFAELLAIKRTLDPGATAVEPWDVLYLEERLKQERYDYDPDEVKQYFPADRVVDGVFGIAKSLYGVTFEEVEGASAWAPDVRLYRVRNLSDSAVVGHLYLDLYPRQGKYGHFAALMPKLGRLKNGTYATPVAVIMGNFDPPADGRPGLLSPQDVETVFHEMGHALHVLFTRAPYGTLSGFECEWDFVECPSQAFEEWAWDPAVMTAISGHYNTSQPIPDALRDRVIASRQVGMSYGYSRILANSLLDMRMHTATGPVDATALSHRTFEEVMGLAPLPNTHQPAWFEHVMDEYDAGYYGYLWSKVYALACVEVFEKAGMTDRATGQRFRSAVLSRGNMATGDALLRDFLGREPGEKALFEFLGVPKTPT